MGEESLFKWSSGHMTIYGKNFENLLLQNQMADDLKTWYAALGA